ncbi:uncharacterized protein LOC110656893 [Hevea brasiliensis]|uniref:uncharacterized protein LOC110656893 n=1 Tax=Hevea brasiliensis TaxID=3981 RepID=UPI0025FDD144|nr:uncharacterized protein LOC110656893 [Hevea brasiliensis]
MALYASLEIDDEGQMMAIWQMKPLLTDRIKIAAQNNEKYVKLMEEAQDGKKLDFSVNDNGLLLHQNRVCIPNDVELRQTFMKEAHNSLFAMHLGRTKMYKIVKEHYWWMDMKKDTVEYVSKCLTCQ